jgi:hypothetical protein
VKLTGAGAGARTIDMEDIRYIASIRSDPIRFHDERTESGRLEGRGSMIATNRGGHDKRRDSRGRELHFVVVGGFLLYTGSSWCCSACSSGGFVLLDWLVLFVG